MATSRRNVLIGTAAAAAAGVGVHMAARAAPAKSAPAKSARGGTGFAKAKDGAEIFYKDWGTGRPIVFSHGWPLCGDAWDPQMMFFGAKGYRVIAHDRRSHGRSTQTWNGNDMDTYADDLAAVFEKLDLKDAILIGHSTGGGEVAHYIGRHGTSRVSKAVLLGAVPPLMVKTAANPEGTPIDAFNGIRAGVLADRSQFYLDLAAGAFFGFNRPGAKKSQGLIESFWLQGMLGGVKGQYDCVREFSEVDYTEDLRKFNIPTLIVHGDDDQVVPIAAAGLKSAKIVKNATLKVYKGAPHGLAATHAEQFNNDVLAFITG